MQARKHASKGIHPGRRHQKSKIGVSVVPRKDLCPPKIFKKKVNNVGPLKF